MSNAENSARGQLSIGEVLAELRPEFSDVTISKLRFLEAEGLVEPERTPAGYRKYSHDHVSRLRYILAAQRDHYLPLRVIREQLEDADRKRVSTAAASRLSAVSSLAPAVATDQVDEPLPRQETWSRDELCEQAGVTDEQLDHIEQYGLIKPTAQRSRKTYGREAYDIVMIVVALEKFGVHPRHLRSYRASADREIGLFTQALAPLAHQRSQEARHKAQVAATELTDLSLRLHAALIRAELRSVLGD